MAARAEGDRLLEGGRSPSEVEVVAVRIGADQRVVAAGLEQGVEYRVVQHADASGADAEFVYWKRGRGHVASSPLGIHLQFSTLRRIQRARSSGTRGVPYNLSRQTPLGHITTPQA